MWKTRGGVQARMSSWVDWTTLFSALVAMSVVVIVAVSVSTALSSPVSTTIILELGVRGGAASGFRSEEEIVG